MIGLEIYSIRNTNSDSPIVGFGLPFFAAKDDDAVNIVRNSLKGVEVDKAVGFYLVHVGTFNPFDFSKVVVGCEPSIIASCVDLCDPGEEVSDEGSEV